MKPLIFIFLKGNRKGMIRTIINGLCMALADSVPGVSGGTVAFIMGFYDKFIGSINDVFYGNMSKRKHAGIYLIKIGIGWIVGMILSVMILTSAFEKHIYVVSSLFMGFIIASIPMVLNEEKESVKVKTSTMVCLGVGIAIVVALTIMNQHTFSAGVNVSKLSFSTGIYIFIGGAASIAAMFLPGISGSTILLVLGLYLPIMKAGRELLHLHFSYLPGMIIFTVGIIVGALSVVKGIQTALSKYRPQTVFLIIGLMIGSLYSIVMGPTTLDSPLPALTIKVFNWPAFFVGIGLIVVLQIAGRQKKVSR